MEYCTSCGTKHPNPDTGLCVDCETEFYIHCEEDNQDLDKGGTGHGDISHSDADEGL